MSQRSPSRCLSTYLPGEEDDTEEDSEGGSHQSVEHVHVDFIAEYDSYGV